MTRHRFYVGTHDKTGHNVSEDAFERIRYLLTNQFGGFTEYQGQGAWYDESIRLIREPSITFEAIGETTASVARMIRDLANQSAVLWTREIVDGEFV